MRASAVKLTDSKGMMRSGGYNRVVLGFKNMLSQFKWR